VNKYQGDVLRIEKFDPDKTFTALYWDASAKSFYIKRFSFALSDNTPTLFIAEGKNSYLVDLSDDARPQFKVEFGGKWEYREPEVFSAEDFIAKKGLAAKGKKVHSLDVAKVYFIEPLEVPEESVPEDGTDDVTSEGDAPETAPQEPQEYINDEPEEGEELTLF
jgi:topoisomerase IV subunit A